MGKTIDGNFELEIKRWYETEVITNVSDTLKLKLKDSNDFLVIQNYVLLCQKHNSKELKLDITCPEEDVFRIKHYLYIIKNKYKNIIINNEIYDKIKEVNFFGIIPLIEINRYNYKFLASSVSEIFYWEQKICVKESVIEKEEQKILANVCMNCLFGEIHSCKDLTVERRNFFNTIQFFEQVKRMPFLAFLLFSVYDRVKHEDNANESKEELKQKSGKTSWKLRKEQAPEAYPNNEEVISDLFNSWDITDGLLQLIENVVEYAGNIDDQKENDVRIEKQQNGKGVFSIRIHKNDLKNENTYLHNEFYDYFLGYENVYKNEYSKFNNGSEIEENCTELDCYNKLQNKRGLTSNELQLLSNIASNMEKRRDSRKRNKHFLDVRIADASGKCMTKVFQNNIKKRKYNAYNDFNTIEVRSFFDPDSKERVLFKKYYQKENLIYHYGLQIFSSVILNNDGYFTIRSHSRDKGGIYSTVNNPKFEFNDMIEGTRYQILLPFRAYRTKATAMINSNINYYSNIKDDYKILTDQDWINEFYKKLQETPYTGNEKEKVVHDLSDLFVEKESEIPIFDVSKIEPANLEILCKAIILHITQIENEEKVFNCAVINCETFHFINIIRIFAVCYDKNGNGSWMKNAQIYLCGNDKTQEFLISGENIATLLQRVEKLAFSRKIHPECLQILRKMLEKRENIINKIDTSFGEEIECFSYTPFDLLLEEDGRTLFERNVEAILKKDVQKVDSGCKIDPIHARLGSKIHIDVFYEAELLFYNNYYTNRFAYLMIKRLIEKDIDRNQPVCFVGYETYSEMLLCEMKKMYEEYASAESTYIIYEIEKEETDKDIRDNCRMRYIERMKENMQVVFVVPINTTLTTFNKLHAALKRRDKRFKTVAYMGVVQIRDTDNTNLCLDECTDLESQYWDNIDTKKRLIESKKLLGKSASYQVCVNNHWEDPLKCKMCFPPDVLFEKPLIETDKASVVPTQLIGLKEKNEKNENEKRLIIDSAGQIESLKEYFYCDHIYRGENHYRYYIRTAKYINDVKNRENIRKWLQDVRKLLPSKAKEKRTAFDIIVNPMHFSSTAFVELVNEVVFNGASYVLRIESEKEFRDNIQTKYSDLRALYENLRAAEKDIDINFHYVDDNIITGKSFNRVKHLIDSLFPYEKDKHVNVNIFSDIIVLLNRLSDSSIHNYISDINNYFCFIDLKISSLRNHGDACFLCKRAEDAKKLAEYASTNVINESWENERKSNRLKSLAKVKEQLVNEVQQESFTQLMCTHEFNKKLEEKGALKNEPLIVYDLVLKMIEEKKGEELYFLKKYLQVISYPFSSYRKSIRECALQMIIILLEMLVMHETCKTLEDRVVLNKDLTEFEKEYMLQFISNSSLLEKVVRKCTSKKKRKDLLELLVQLSVELKSNYIIRKDRIEKIIEFAQNNIGISKELALFMISQVKKLISLSSDEAKGVYLEKELNEILKKKLDSNIVSHKMDMNIYILLAYYMENTRGVYDAVLDLNKFNDIEEVTLTNYYFDNYLKILSYNEINKEQIEISNKFLKLYKDLECNNHQEATGEFKRYIEYYNTIAKDIKDLLDLEKLYFLISRKEKSLTIKANNDVDYMDGITHYDIFAHSEDGNVYLSDKEEKILIESESEYYLDTVHVVEEYGIIVLKKQQEDGKYFKPIYLLLKFKKTTLFEKYRVIRWCLMYRNKMLSCFENDFSNNIIQNWVETSNIIKHLRKARAFMHSRDQNDYDPKSVWANCKRLFYGRPQSIAKSKEEFKSDMEGFILELMTDIRLGRINMLLLSDVEFQQMNLEEADYSRMETIKGYVEAIKNAFFWKNVYVCDENAIIRNDVLDSLIENSYIEKNQEGKYSCHNEYLVYLIYEALHSAVRYGFYEDDEHIYIQVYRDGKYLCIKNKVKDDFDIENVKNGLSRKGNGISLATICEYIIREYPNRRAKIILDENYFTLALPIFKEE